MKYSKHNTSSSMPVAWHQFAMGDVMRRHIESNLCTVREHLFSEYSVAVGDLSCQLEWPTGMTKRRINYGQHTLCADVIGDLAELPFISHSVNVFYLCLTLEYCRYPHALLREINRCITDDGVLVIVGFNNLSVANLSRWLPLSSASIMRQARFLSTLRLQDWLRLLDFEVLSQPRYLVSDLIIDHKAWNQSQLNESLQHYLSPFGSLYTMVAQKRTISPTWRHQVSSAHPSLA